jgi:hypothetical protein
MASLKGGDRLEAALNEIARGLSTAASVDIGFLEGATYPDGTSVPMVAAINEYGRSKVGQPPRPFFRNMIKAKSREWPDAVAALLKANDYDAARTLAKTGDAIKGQLQQSITTFISPGLAPSTIANKGFDKPLVDTGVMLNSIDYRVK